MKIFKLKRNSASVDWEELMNATVIAENELEARMIAYMHFMKEGCEEYAHELMDPEKCTCTVIPLSNGVIANEYKTA